MNNNFDIDVVITWVDGNEREHVNKINKYIEDKSKLNNQKFLTRFNQVNEIEFCVKSILKFAPYIRTIFIVTDQQTPTFIKNKLNSVNYQNIKIIDHKVIFKGYENYLPTFNSNSIETMLNRIPGLAEHFIYFNDDLFLIKETKPTDFFKNGNPIIRGKWTAYDSDKIHKVVYQKILRLLGKETKDKKGGYKKAQQNIAQILEFKKYLKLDHTPAALRKSTIKGYFEQYPNMLIHNIKFRFRHPSYYMIQSLANHLEIKSKSCELKSDYQLGYFQSYRKLLFWYKIKLKYFARDTNKLFLCMQSLDLCPKDKLSFILNWLNKQVC